MNPIIGGLQGDFGDLDNKYLKYNISKYRWQKSGSFRRTPQHCAKWLLSHPGRRYQMIWIRPSGEVETLSFSIRHQNSGHEHPGGSARQSGANGAHIRVQMAPTSGCKWRRTSRVQILSGYVVRTPFDGVSGRPVQVYSLHGFQRTLLNLILLW